MNSGGREAAGQRVLDGRYRLEEVIGRGGMSTVYRGTDLALDRVVAVKVALDPLADENPVYVARFKREAHAAAALSHPGVVTVYDAGADGPTRYIVMEHAEGHSLSDLLRGQGPAHPALEPARAARIAEQIADALAAAHAAGIIHRDIKPGNVMVGPDDRVKVLDFGIAHTADAVTLTQTASVLGTAPYMAPEQAMGSSVDARSDIYSLGCVLYEMLTGTPPFMADVPAAVMHQHVRVPPKAPSALNPDVPPALDALVLQMLAKQPDDRPQTAAEVRDRLVAYRTGTVTEPTRPMPPPVEARAGVAAVAADVPGVATAPQAATVPPKAAPATPVRPTPSPAPRSRRGLWAALAAICVVLLGAAVAYAIAGGGSSASDSSQSHPAATATVTVTNGTTNAATHAHSTPSTSTPSTTSSSSTSTSTSTSSSSKTTTTTTTAPATGGVAPGQANQSTTTK